MKQYLKERQSLSILFIVWTIIYLLSYWLYNLPLKIVWYPSLLCLLSLIIYITIDYYKYKRRHNTLTKCLEFHSLDDMRVFTNQLDQDYQSLIDQLEERINNIQTENASKQEDIIDYYTTWVHQIKTPIASMRLTLDKEDSAQARQLRAQLFDIEQYVSMVLGYLRLNSESTDYLFTDTNLDDVIKGCIRDYRAQFITKGLKFNYIPTDKKVITDEKWLSFVIGQILSNALKYTPSGSISIIVQDESITISDTGIGISPDDLPRIFEKGYTGHTGRINKHASGLGLYLCHQICKNLGHELTVVSEVGKGTAFTITFSSKKYLFE